MLEPALALLEFRSIAAGIEAADAMAKKAPIEWLRTGTVQPGKYLVLIGGEVADVEESLEAGLEVGGNDAIDFVYLPRVHPDVVVAIEGGRVPQQNDSLGIIETTTVAAAIVSADAGVKGAEVKLAEVRLADGLGGKGLVFFSGLLADVEAAIEIGVGVLSRELLVRQVIIPQLHEEMWTNMADSTRFRHRVINQLS